MQKVIGVLLIAAVGVATANLVARQKRAGPLDAVTGAVSGLPMLLGPSRNWAYLVENQQPGENKSDCDLCHIESDDVSTRVMAQSKVAGYEPIRVVGGLVGGLGGNKPGASPSGSPPAAPGGAPAAPGGAPAAPGGAPAAPGAAPGGAPAAPGAAPAGAAGGGSGGQSGGSSGGGGLLGGR